MDDEGTNDDKQMIVYWAISRHFIPQNSRGSEFTRSRGDLNRWSTHVNVPIKIASLDGVFVNGIISCQNNKENNN